MLLLDILYGKRDVNKMHGLHWGKKDSWHLHTGDTVLHPGTGLAIDMSYVWHFRARNTFCEEFSTMKFGIRSQMNPAKPTSSGPLAKFYTSMFSCQIYAIVAGAFYVCLAAYIGFVTSADDGSPCMQPTTSLRILAFWASLCKAGRLNLQDCPFFSKPLPGHACLMLHHDLAAVTNMSASARNGKSQDCMISVKLVDTPCK